MRAVSIRGVVELEQRVLESPPLADVAPGPPSLHIDAAAWATALALERAEPGIYNIAEPGPQLNTDKARTKLDWSADWRAP
jgi:hypothetical protein